MGNNVEDIARTQTEDQDSQMDDISNSEVSRGWDMYCHTLKLFSQYWGNFCWKNTVIREEESGNAIGEHRL